MLMWVDRCKFNCSYVLYIVLHVASVLREVADETRYLKRLPKMTVISYKE